MNVFRVFIIVLAFSLIAGSVVHIRLKNWHYAYLINQLYDKNSRLQREYTQIRLDLARYQNPDNLLDRLKEMNMPLEGVGVEDEKKVTQGPKTKKSTPSPKKTTTARPRQNST
jgi:hypothetical protein